MYLQACAKVLARERDAQILILVPEINLTPQLEGNIRARFPGDAASPDLARKTPMNLTQNLVLVAIIGLDTWAAFAWSGGAGQLGVTLAAICASVSLVFLVFLVTDARRHWPNAHNRR